MNMREQNPAVFFATDAVRMSKDADIHELMERAHANPSGVCRVCLHRSVDEVMHEMLIAMRTDVQYPPHRHVMSEETQMVLYGLASLRLFDESGHVTQTIPMGPSFTSGRVFHVRIPKGTYHDMLIETSILVLLESTLGPFRPNDNEKANWKDKT